MRDFVIMLAITVIGVIWATVKAYQLDEEIELVKSKARVLNSINVICLDPKVEIPSYKTNGAAGLDLAILQSVSIKSHETLRLKTGLAMEIPENHVGLVFPRSSMFFAGLDISGVIDSDYRGEIQIQVQNNSANPINLTSGQRLAQLVIVPVKQYIITPATKLSETTRNNQGFGSTGK